jgi:hypothetical protein
VLGAGRHIGGKVVNLPVAGDGGVQRVQPSIDRHRAVLARLTVRPARVEVAENRQVVAGKFGQCRGQLAGCLDSKEMTPAVEPWSSDQKRKPEPM